MPVGDTPIGPAPDAYPPVGPAPAPASIGEQPGRAGDLTADTLVRYRSDRPQQGWRHALYAITAGLVNPGPGPAELARQQLRARVRRHLVGPHRIAVISVKGGIGKTTTAACVGMALAEIRGDQVGVVDANPDAGTLADRLTGNTAVTIRQLLGSIQTISSLTQVNGYLSLAGRLKVLASEQDPAASEALSAEEYEQVIDLLSRFLNIVITDSGTGISHPTVGPTLRLADSLVIVGAPTVDGASRAGHTLDWLHSHGFQDKARNAVVVLSGDRTSPDVDADQVRTHFTRRARAVVCVPHDPHLAAGGLIDFEKLRDHTRDAYTQVAAHIADEFTQRTGSLNPSRSS